MKRATFRVPPGDRPGPENIGHGFTLLELLMVLAVIAILAGTLGLALGGRGGVGGSLANAQNIVAGLVGATRAEAALHQTNARLIVHAQPPPRGSAVRYLRVLQVVREEPFGSDAYVAVGDPVALPEPVCVVPASAVPADHLGPGVTWPAPPATVSTLLERDSFHYLGRAGAGAQRQFFGQPNTSGRIFFLEVGPDGLVSKPVTGASVILAAALLSEREAPRFSNGHNVRGVMLRHSGTVALMDGPEGF